MAYAVTYPFGLVGPILLIVLYRWMFKADPAGELQELSDREAVRRPPIGHVDIEVTNPRVVGVALSDLHCVRERGIILSLLLRNNVLSARRQRRRSNWEIITALWARRRCCRR